MDMKCDVYPNDLILENEQAWISQWFNNWDWPSINKEHITYNKCIPIAFTIIIQPPPPEFKQEFNQQTQKNIKNAIHK